MNFPFNLVSGIGAIVVVTLVSSSALADETAKNVVVFGNTTLDEVSLIGLSKDEALKRLGAPDQVLGPEEGLQTYNYSSQHQLSVVFHHGKLVQYILGQDSKARTSTGVTMGAHLGAVIAQYGDYSREEDVSEWFGGSEAKVLYHHPEFKKFKIIYPGSNVIFMLDEERNVEVIWVGFPTK